MEMGNAMLANAREPRDHRSINAFRFMRANDGVGCLLVRVRNRVYVARKVQRRRRRHRRTSSIGKISKIL